ncbi:MAG: hypothetical protein JW706_05080 [Opitutales bacterium]|nr:hypothetical protein [Opitutales bacterium]
MKSVVRACLFSVLLLAGAQAAAFVMDWDRVVWSADGSAGQYANADGSAVDVSVTITLSDARYDGSDASVVRGTDGAASLMLSMDAPNHSDRYSHYMDVRIRFSRAVSGVGFDISGINYGSSGNHGQGNSGYAFDDLIERIEGSVAGVGVAANVEFSPGSVAASVLTTENGGSTTGYSGVSSAEPGSLIHVSWETGVVDDVSIRYATGPRARNNPSAQFIGLGGVDFNPAVPEPATWLLGIFGFVLLGLRHLMGNWRLGSLISGCVKV